MYVNEQKDYGVIRPGADAKDAKYFWDESLPNSSDRSRTATSAESQNFCVNALHNDH